MREREREREKRREEKKYEWEQESSNRCSDHFSSLSVDCFEDGAVSAVPQLLRDLISIHRRGEERREILSTGERREGRVSVLPATCPEK